MARAKVRATQETKPKKAATKPSTKPTTKPKTETHGLDVLALLGKALDSAEVKAFLKATGCKQPKRSKYMDSQWEVDDDACGLVLELVPADEYDGDFAVPAVAKRPTDYVVADVDLLGAGQNRKTTRAYAHAMPFGLVFGDPGETVITKVGSRPSSREKGTSYAHAWWFRIGNIKMLAALDGETRLLWLRFVPLDKKEARAIARKAASRKR